MLPGKPLGQGHGHEEFSGSSISGLSIGHGHSTESVLKSSVISGNYLFVGHEPIFPSLCPCINTLSTDFMLVVIFNFDMHSFLW